VHHHGCWGVIGYLRGGDEETRFREVDGAPQEVSRHVWHQGDVTDLLPEEGEGWHRVRNPGPGTGVSVHVLCRTPADHPHRYWDREGGRALDFPFVEVAPRRWVARVDPTP
jgi:predicted metal-dependent enzyme (double-stranded beta helix superfamily)